MAIPDPYGTDVLLTDCGDLAVTPAGQLAVIDGPLNCGQAMVLRMRTHEGELALHPEWGSAIDRLVIGTKAGDPSLVASRINVELREILETDRRFLRASKVEVTQDAASPSATGVLVELVLAGGEQLAVDDLLTISLDDVAAAAPDEIDALGDADLPEFLGDDDPDVDDEDLEGDDDLEGLDADSGDDEDDV